ncbi:hypothetical protein Taro_010715 [Colocasia esculenta]|uniref:Uncharacterized protein n=1 Tax=Colocasia esculenta TaxID=4460 RepID=A0A843U891_COLES|nr:hypothetical protein [Colocasia esculenta]
MNTTSIVDLLKEFESQEFNSSVSLALCSLCCSRNPKRASGVFPSCVKEDLVGIHGVVFPSVVKEDLVGIQGVVVPFV